MKHNHVIDLIKLSSNAASFGEEQCSLHNKFARAESSATPEYTYTLAVATCSSAVQQNNDTICRNTSQFSWREASQFLVDRVVPARVVRGWGEP